MNAASCFHIFIAIATKSVTESLFPVKVKWKNKSWTSTLHNKPSLLFSLICMHSVILCTTLGELLLPCPAVIWEAIQGVQVVPFQHNYYCSFVFYWYLERGYMNPMCLKYRSRYCCFVIPRCSLNIATQDFQNKAGNKARCRNCNTAKQQKGQ